MTQIGFSTPRRFNPLSWLIRKMTGSQCSHAWFLYKDPDFEMDCVMEAHELGFRILPFATFERSNIIVKVVTPKNDISLGLKRVAQEYLGTTYDFMGLIGMGWVALGRFLKTKWKNPFRSAKVVFCSEAVGKALKWSPGYANTLGDPEDMEPQDLLNWFEANEKA